MAYSDLELTIVNTVREALAEDPFTPPDVLHERLAKAGIVLQPYDLKFVLSRHPGIFRLSYKGDWKLA
jgi:hypothetical protein